MANNTNGGGTPQGAAGTQNPDTNANAAPNLSAFDRFVQMTSTIENGGNPTREPEEQHAEHVEQPGSTETGTDLPGNETNVPTDQLATGGEGGEGGEGGGNGNVTMPPQLAALDAGVRDELLELAQNIADGVVNLGDVKRGHRIALNFAQEREELNGQIAALKEQLASGAPGGAAPGMLPSVANLKTADDVDARQDQLQTVLDWCVDNADGGTMGEGDNEKTFTAAQVRDIRDDARKEMRQLPKRLAQIEGAAKFTRAQGEAKTNGRNFFPILTDANNAETKQVRQLLANAPWIAKQFIAPEIAALTWIRGTAAMRADYGKRFPGNGNGASRNANGNGVQRGRPGGGGTSAGGAAPRTTGPTVKSVKERLDSGDRSVGALADLIQVAGDRFVPKP